MAIALKSKVLASQCSRGHNIGSFATSGAFPQAGYRLVRLLGRVEVKGMTVSEVEQPADRPIPQPGHFQEPAARRRACQPAAVLHREPGREGWILPLHQRSDSSGGGGDRRPREEAPRSSGLTHPKTSPSPKMHRPIWATLCPGAIFLKHGERLAACRKRKADLPAGVRLLYDGCVRDRISRECT
jgi:hypothetical protein